jgi:hypothetical protein
MASKSNRVFITVTALLIGVSIVFGLTKLSNSSVGPLEEIINSFQKTVHDIELKSIIKKRVETRSEKLKWLKKYIIDIEELKHPKPLFIGAFDNNAVTNFRPILNLEDSLNTNFPLIHIYTAWGSKTDQAFPKKQVMDIADLGSIPVITWEPWLTDFIEDENINLRPKAIRDKQGMTDVANGVYDFYIKAWAADAKKVKTPIIVRLAHEMNDPYRYPWGPQNNEAKDFVLAWKHIHDLFKEQGVKNIVWVWAPHPAYGYFNEYYPGSEYVDYVGTGTLNYGPVVNWGKWWSFDEILGNHYDELASFKKPMMLTEFASLAYGGDRNQWYEDALREIPLKYPLVKSLLFFHFDADNTTTLQVLNWNIINDQQIIKTVKDNIAKWPDSLQMK